MQALLEEETKQKLALQSRLRNVEQQLEQARDQLDEEEEAKKNLEKQVTFFCWNLLKTFNFGEYALCQDPSTDWSLQADAASMITSYFTLYQSINPKNP